MKKPLRLWSSVILALSTLVFDPAQFTETVQAAVTDKCDGTSTQNNIKVTATHGKVFYIDSQQGQNVDASYVGYQVTSSSAKTNVWAQLDGFSGGVVQLANPNDKSLSLGDISGSTDTKTAFFLLKAPTSSSSAQSHTVKIFLGKPGNTGASEQYSCTFSFIKVAETIKAQANKVNTITQSAAAYVLGANMTVVVSGDCGTVGQGSSIDADMIWISPAARSTWPTSALRLTSTRLKLDDQSNLNSPFLDQNDVLQVKSLRTKIGGNPYKCYYEATYTFKIIGTTESAVSLSPIAQISSGTQIKHTNMEGAAITGQSGLPTNSVTINASVSKSIATGTTQSDGKTNLNYTITLTNSNASNALIFDEVIDTPDTGVAYVASSVRIAGATTSEPVTDSAGKLIFSQPITVNASSSKTITYTMRENVACTSSATIRYTNSAIGKVGNLQIGSSATAYSVTRAAGTCGVANLTDTSTTSTAFAVEVVTNPATAIGNLTATLNGTVDPNSLSGQTISFQYGTSSVLSTSTTVNLGTTTTSATTPYGVSTAISGLTTGTVYYFRIRVGSVTGSILSFVTTEAVGTPTATTTFVSGVTSVGGGGSTTFTVTFNGTVDANQVAGGAGAKFEYAQDGTQSSSATCATQSTIETVTVFDLDEAGDPTTTPISLTGAFSVDVFTTKTSLVQSKYYCFRTVATYSTSSTAYGSWVSFYTGSFSSQTITFNQITTKSTTETHTLTASASSTLPISYQSNSPSVCTISGTTVTFLIGGTCSITASQPGNYQFYPADPVTVSFLVTAPTRTITFDNNGGSGTMSSQSANTPTDIKLNSFTRTGFSFDGWSTSSGTQSVAYIDGQEYNFSADLNLYAQWTANTYTITYKAGTGGSGSDVQQVFTYGANPSLHTNSTTNFTNAGKVATGWNEATGGGGNAWAFSASYTAASDLTLYAQWATQYTVTFNDNYSTPAVTTTQSSHVAANLTANPWSRTGYSFGGWASTSANATAGTVAYANNASYPFTSSTTLYAIWSINSYTFAYDSNTATSGSAPAGGGSKSFGTTITAASNTYTKTDHRFDHWYTTASGTGGTAYTPTNTFDMPANNVTLYAQWTRVYTVTLGTLGGGSTSTISITTSPAAAGETVSLGISAESGYRLVSGSLTATHGSSTATINGSGPYTFTMPAANVVITANFELIPAGNFTLTVTPGSGGSVSAGSGAISSCTSTPSGTCSGSYASATSVVLTATPSTGFVVSSWGGVCSGSGNTCTVYMDNDKTATVTFIATFTITLTPTTGNGSVGSSPAGISGCATANSACTATYNSGTSVTLTATPSAGYVVNAWTGDCSGSGTTCTLILSSNKTVGISYAQTFTVTIGTLTNGTGSSISVATSPSVSGATITLTISPASGNQLKAGTLVATPASGSTPSVSGSSNTYTFTMPASNVTVTAEFETATAGTYTITINSATGGSGSSSVATVSSGGSVTLTATASSGYTFSSWSCTGGGTLSSSTANPATLSNITANATCTPVFTQNSSGGGGGGGGGGGPVVRSSNKIVVTRIINNQPTNTTTGSRPVFNGTNTTLTPGNSANRTSTILPTAATSTTSTGGVVAVVTNPSSQAPVNNPNQSAASQGLAAVNASNTTAQTIFERRADLPSSVVVSRDANNGIQVSANNGWTGRVSVSVINGEADTDVETFVEVVIAPTPITAPRIIQEEQPAIQKAEEKPKPGLIINWAPSQSEVVGYVVTVNSQPTCFSMTTSCEINQLIGPKTKVAVIAQGNDNTFSAPVTLSAFKPTRPIPALVVNFAVASSVLTPKFKADLRNLAKVMVKEGFTKVDIAGHTDSTGQAVSYDNQRLSDARAKATLNYLKRFVPRLKSVTGAYAFERRITNEANPDELYTNRRAEVSVS